MKTISLSEIRSLINDYCENFKNRKPLMFWFHSNPDIDKVKHDLTEDREHVATMEGHPFKQGNRYMIKDGKTVPISMHPEVLDEFIFPATFKETTKMFVYHRYLQQLELKHLQYCMDMIKIGGYPVVCLMNDYAKDDKNITDDSLQYIEQNFEQYDVTLTYTKREEIFPQLNRKTETRRKPKIR